MGRYVCIHGHFYQPPRENPWLEDVELQDSASPYHDWNERITAECYAANAAARTLDSKERIRGITSNYGRISYNFGPTLLGWLERKHPEVYSAILQADQQSQRRFSGHGAALAQAYNHLIMPLANERDKQTQVIWGIKDFTHRFQRIPEGMWLPETAVDIPTLEMLALHGIKFTLLAPHQALRIRPPEKEEWCEISTSGVDTTRPYLCNLPSGRQIYLFFYQGEIAQQVAFGGLLNDGKNFAEQLLNSFPAGEHSQVVHIATDGETYGHHHQFGEMALSFALDHIEQSAQADLAIYGQVLAQTRDFWEVEIVENTSWSCTHGIGRWQNDCGCCSGGKPDWNQQWRHPLRKALDWLRDELAKIYTREMTALGLSPWEARDQYINVILDRSRDGVAQFFQSIANRPLSQSESVKALQLLEMQRQALLMYTSCGWFFDDVSGIESIQILCYACRGLQLAKNLGGPELEISFASLLQQVPCNDHRWENAAHLYREVVLPMRLDLARVAAHHAIYRQINQQDPASEAKYSEQIYCYTTQTRGLEVRPAGRMRIATGELHIQSELTWEEEEFAMAVLYMGGHHLIAGLKSLSLLPDFTEHRKRMHETFEDGDIPKVIRRFDEIFEGSTYSLRHLFKDEQRLALSRLMEHARKDVQSATRQIYQNHFALLRYLCELKIPLPAYLEFPVSEVLNSQMETLLTSTPIIPGSFTDLFREAQRVGLSLNNTHLGQIAGKQIVHFLTEAQIPYKRSEALQELEKYIQSIALMGLNINLWQAQNLYYALRTQEHISASPQLDRFFNISPAPLGPTT